MLHKIKTYIETNHLITDNNIVVVGFSGGCDSVSLLYILNRLGYNCIAAHCNFHLRGDESDRDESFCKNFAKEHKIHFEKTDFDTQKYASKQHISIEMAARELRYQWFETLRKKYEAHAIAIAHHRDDSVETFLLNLLRGSGIHGLCGIRKKNGYIIRPLLCVSRNEILKFTEEQKLQYVTDSSNLKDEYTRNFIRLNLLPMMEKINSSAKTAISRTAENIADAETIYSDVIENAKKNLQYEHNDEIHIPIDKLMEYPAPKTILYEILKPFGFSRQISDEIFKRTNGESGKIFESKDYKLIKDRENLLITKEKETSKQFFSIEKGCFETSSLPIKLEINKETIDNKFIIDKAKNTATFDYDKLKFPLILRHWQNGDWFCPFGMKGRKKISDYFNDNKYSIIRKNKTWLLCDNTDIIWIVGERTDNRYLIDKKTKTALVIKFFS